MHLQESTLKNMARLLPRETRLKLFEDLCKILGEPIPERVWLATGIRKTDVYRYLPKSRSLRGGLVPNPKTTMCVIKALLKKGAFQVVLKALGPVEEDMRKTYFEYFKWKKELRNRNVIYNPLSHGEIDKLERSLY